MNINAANVTRWFRVRAVRRTGTPGNWSAIVSGTTLWQDGLQILANSITETKIANDSISTPKLKANSVTANEIAAATITGTQLRTDIAVITNSAQIANLIVGNQHIANATITSAKIGNAQILTANIGDLNVTTIKIANNAVTNKGENHSSGGSASVNVTLVSGNAVLVIGRVTAYSDTQPNNLGERFGIYGRLKRGSTVIDQIAVSDLGGRLCAVCVDIDSPGSGTKTYTMEGAGWFNSTDGSTQYADAYIHVTEFIK